MSTHQKKVTTIFLLLLITVTVKCYSQYAVGVSYGLDPKERYLANSIGDRATNLHHVTLSVLKYLEFSKVLGMIQLSSAYNYGKITPQMFTSSPQKIPNTMNYLNFGISGKAILGESFIAPMIGLNAGFIPKYLYEINNSVEEKSNAYNWGLIGGLACFLTSKSLVTLSYDYGKIYPGQGDKYNRNYGFISLSYQYSFSSLKHRTFKQWRQSRRSKKE